MQCPKIFGVICWICLVTAHDDARELFEDLLSNYNSIVRPVQNASDILTVKFGASLIRIIDVDEKNQVLTTNLWLEIQWVDSKLRWSPVLYGGIKKLHIPSDQLWKPDIVLYNNAAGDPEITIFNDALVYYDGTVVWKPPTIYTSFCDIDVTWFPYDDQLCHMKFGMWTYTGNYVDMRQLPEENVTDISDKDGKSVQYLAVGMDLSYYYRSAEWDLLNVTSIRHEEIYTSCCGPEKYIDISYSLSIRRKTLFYTVNLTVPCALISFLTTYVFYLPAHSDKKITFAISILVTLTVFFLVLIDMIPPTSVVIPLFGKYLTFTMVLVSFSIVISVITVNFHHRSGNTHKMPRWMRVIFLSTLPKWLCMERPRHSSTVQETSCTAFAASFNVCGCASSVCEEDDDDLSIKPKDRRNMENDIDAWSDSERQQLNSVPSSAELLRKMDFVSPGQTARTRVDVSDIGSSIILRNPYVETSTVVSTPSAYQRRMCSVRANFGNSTYYTGLFERMMLNVQIIAQHFKEIEEYDEVSADWTYVAMVIDRLFLWIFSICNILGTMLIILQAPSFYDQSVPLIIPDPTRPLGGDTLSPHYD